MNWIQNVFNANFWAKVFLGNSGGDYLTALIIFLGLILFLGIFYRYILKRLEVLASRTKTLADDMILRVIRSVKPPFYYFLAFYIAFRYLKVSPAVGNFINSVLIIWVVYQVIIILQIFVEIIARRRFEEAEASSALSLIRIATKIVLWTFGALLVLSNLGVNINSLIAGLGITGVAVALAIQRILGDLFSSFAIYLDKPFRIGDFIMVKDKIGTVEQIGIKSTRIRSVQGEEIIISNAELTTSHIQNFRRMRERGVTINFKIGPEAPVEKLHEIPGVIRKLVEEQRLVRFDRAHFREFDGPNLVVEVTYHVLSPLFTVYLDINQQILLRIKEEFAKEKIVLV